MRPAALAVGWVASRPHGKRKGPPVVASNEYLSLKQAAAAIPTRPHVCTIWRWVSRGVRGHRLRTVKIGGQTYTTAKDIDAFLSAINGGPVSVGGDRARHLKRVNKQLDAELA